MNKNKLNIELPKELQEEFENLCLKHPHLSETEMLENLIRLGLCTNTIMAAEDKNLKQLFLFLMMSERSELQELITCMESRLTEISTPPETKKGM